MPWSGGKWVVLTMPVKPRGYEELLEGSREVDLECAGRGTSLSRLGSFPPTSDKTLPPTLPIFLGGSFCRSVEFSQDRPLLPGLEFSVLPPPGAGLSLEQGSDGEEKRGALPQRLWVFMSTLAPSLEEMDFELGEAQAVFLPIIFLAGCLDQPRLDFGFFAFGFFALKLWQSMRVPEVG